MATYAATYGAYRETVQRTLFDLPFVSLEWSFSLGKRDARIVRA
jgi:hypothetical protein